MGWETAMSFLQAEVVRDEDSSHWSASSKDKLRFGLVPITAQTAMAVPTAKTTRNSIFESSTQPFVFQPFCHGVTFRRMVLAANNGGALIVRGRVIRTP